MSIVSENIKFLRKSNSLTQEQFAAQIGIKRSLLGAYEEGRANPNLGNLMNIAKIFGMAVDELLQNDLRKAGEVPSLKSAGRTAEPASTVERRTSSTAKPQSITSQAPVMANGRVQPESRPTTTAVYSSPKEQVHATALSPTGHAGANETPAYGLPGKTAQELSREVHRFPAPLHPTTPGHTSLVVPLIKAEQAAGYVLHHAQANFLQQLPALHLPNLAPGNYRAFETGDDFAFPGAIVVGQQVSNLYDIVDGKNYLLVLHQKGIVYRRVYSQMRIKGTLLLTSDKASIPSLEISAKEALEVWEAKAFFSTQMPEPTVSLDRLSQLVADMQQELDRLKK